MLLLGSLSAHVNDTSLLRVQIDPETIRLEWNLDLLTLQKIHPLPRQPDGVIQRESWERESQRVADWLRARLELSLDGGAPDLGVFEGTAWESESDRVAETSWQSAHLNVRFERKRRDDRGGVRVSAESLLRALGEQHNVIVAFVQGADSEQAVLNRQFPAVEYMAVSKRAWAGSWGRLFRLGLDHILSGYDHLLFLAMLLVAVASWQRLVAIITAFTLAHGVTLTLSALRVVDLPGKAVECAIALSIAWVAVENLLKRQVAPRGALTFAFGLVHGLGFAGALRDLDLPRQGLIQSVLSFNLGVEAGQLLFVALVFPVLCSLRGGAWEARTERGISVLAGTLALVWFVERALE
jgi:hypothetical protein